jgi:hypothetical protein
MLSVEQSGDCIESMYALDSEGDIIIGQI